MEKYIFRPYDPRFPLFFQQEKEKIGSILADHSLIEHIGSTAVPGLGGKGIVDVLVAVEKENLQETSLILQKEGYLHVEEDSIPERLFHQIDYQEDGGERRVHVHLVPINSREWKEKIGFRDYLRKNPQEMKKYEELKKEGASICQGSKEIYGSHKKSWIDEINKRVTD